MKCNACRSGLLAALFLTTGAAFAAQNNYPERPIRFIVPYAVGGTSDLVGRLVGAKLSAALGQQLVVDNRGGGGSTIGTALVASANPDGYTLIVNNIGLAVNETLRPERGYVALRDLAPVSLVGFTPSVLVVNNAFPAKNVAEFVALARAQPGKIAFGSAGAGSSTHLSMAYLLKVAKIDLLHVPYKGGGPAVRDTIAGHVKAVMSPVPTVFGHLKAKRLRGIGQSGTRRSSVLPDMPTVAESGVPGYEFSTWYGVLVPAKTPKAVIAKLNRAMVSGLKSADMKQKLGSQGMDPEPTSPEAFGKLIRDEIAKWAEVIKSAGIGRS
jgi:tripartite-type tricarboxylate transporter receptor subunit TctC